MKHQWLAEVQGFEGVDAGKELHGFNWLSELHGV